MAEAVPVIVEKKKPGPKPKNLLEAEQPKIVEVVLVMGVALASPARLMGSARAGDGFTFRDSPHGVLVRSKEGALDLIPWSNIKKVRYA